MQRHVNFSSTTPTSTSTNLTSTHDHVGKVPPYAGVTLSPATNPHLGLPPAVVPFAAPQMGVHPSVLSPSMDEDVVMEEGDVEVDVLEEGGVEDVVLDEGGVVYHGLHGTHGGDHACVRPPPVPSVHKGPTRASPPVSCMEDVTPPLESLFVLNGAPLVANWAQTRERVNHAADGVSPEGPSQQTTDATHIVGVPHGGDAAAPCGQAGASTPVSGATFSKGDNGTHHSTHTGTMQCEAAACASPSGNPIATTAPQPPLASVPSLSRSSRASSSEEGDDGDLGVPDDDSVIPQGAVDWICSNCGDDRNKAVVRDYVGVSTLRVDGLRIPWVVKRKRFEVQLPYMARGYKFRKAPYNAHHLCWWKQGGKRRPCDAQKGHTHDAAGVEVEVEMEEGQDTVFYCKFTAASSCKGCPLYADLVMSREAVDDVVIVRVGPLLVLSRPDQAVKRQYGPWGQSLKLRVEQSYEGGYNGRSVTLETRGPSGDGNNDGNSGKRSPSVRKDREGEVTKKPRKG